MRIRAVGPGALAALALAGSAAAQFPNQQIPNQPLPNQSFEIVPAVTHATVGDLVTLRFRVRLSPGDLLYDTIPQPVGDLPNGVRILSIQKLHRDPDRIYRGEGRVTFYRTGRQAVPVFGLPFMRSVKGLTRGMLLSDSAFVQIDPVAPAGNPPLKDVKDIARVSGRNWRLIGAGVAALLAALVVLIIRWRGRRRHRAEPHAPGEIPVPQTPALAPYDAALARLEEIDRDGWAARGDAARHYAMVTDALRQYLADAHGVPALERTTRELLATLPHEVARPLLAERCAALLTEADLVKFGRAGRRLENAEEFSRDARVLLDAWHHAARSDNGRPATTSPPPC
ncbi:MAG TPA: hypothetical protein VFW66_12195 [Gemmatimonadales bacterium]|nr:hypothetical protein [Gemmatimonadales bacterium]